MKLPSIKIIRYFLLKAIFYTIFAFMKISSIKKCSNSTVEKKDFLLWLWVIATLKAVEKTAFLVHKGTCKMMTGVPYQK